MDFSQGRAGKETLAALHTAYDIAHHRLVAKVNARSPAELTLRTGLPAPRNEAVSIETYLTVEILEHLRVHAREIEDTSRQHGA